jgi:hypothetical protein
MSTAAFLAFRRRVFTAYVVVFDTDEAIRILLVFPEPEVPPMHRDELAATKARPQCHQE